MTSYQHSIHTYSNFKFGDDNKGSFVPARRPKTKQHKKKTSLPPVQKLYSVTGTAPAPSKDFFELVVNKTGVIFRKWRIRFTKSGKMAPSEDRLDIESFLDSDVVQNEIERNLGDDALNMAIGHITQNWLPRLPIRVLALITSYLDLPELSRLHTVCTVFNKRLQYDAVWKLPLVRDFELTDDEITRIKNSNKNTSLRYIYRQEMNKAKEAEIDWDNV